MRSCDIYCILLCLLSERGVLSLLTFNGWSRDARSSTFNEWSRVTKSSPLSGLSGDGKPSKVAFSDWPNAVTSYKGENTTLRWTLNQAVVYTNSFSVEFWYEKPNEALICSWSGGKSTVHYGGEYNASIAKPGLEEGSDVISLSLYNLQPAAAKYNYKCKIHVGSHTVVNSMAWIILYDVPTRPVINSPANVLLLHENVTLSCSAKSTTTIPRTLPSELKNFSSLTYAWRTEHSFIQTDNIHTLSGSGNANITISDLQVEDNGQNYTCIARESGSKLNSSADKTLVVMYKPGEAKAVNSSIGPYFEGHQSEIKLACQVTNAGNPKARWKWRRNGVVEAVTNSSSYTIAPGELSALDHNGIWQCTPFNQVGSGLPATINLTVYGKPAFVVRPHDKAVRSDMVYALDVLCSVKGMPTPRVTWRYKNGPLPDGVTVSPVADVIGTDGLTVVGKRLIWSKNSTESERRASSGVYVCTGVIDSEEISVEVAIDVQYKPGAARADPKQVGPYFEHHPADVRLRCNVNDSGHPAARMEWIRQGITAGDTRGNTFVIPRGNLSVAAHDGYWRCTPYNAIGRGTADRFEVLVYVEPEIVATTRRTTANAEVATDFSAVCSVSGRPAPVVGWQYRGGALPDAVVVENDAEASTGRTVTVSSRLKWSDASSLEQRRRTSGVYTCVGKVGDRETRHNVDVDVHFAPYDITILPPGDNISRVEDEDLRLLCAAVCNPNCTYTWTKDGIVVSSHDVLRFQAIDRDDRGSYTCRATNGPSEEIKVHIEVLSAPFEPENFRVTVAKPRYIIVQWLTGYNGGFNQSFTIQYVDVSTGQVLQTSSIRDTGRNSSHLMEYNITEGIEPATRYELQIFAENSQGRTTGEFILIVTPALAKFVNKPVIVLVKGHAHILFVISGLATRLKVENCVEQTTVCAMEDVVVPEIKRESTDSSAVRTEFMANVDLADSGAKAFYFKFWIYDESELVNREPVIVVAKKSSNADRILKVAAILIVFLVILLAIILLIRFRRNAKREKRQAREKKVESEEEEADESTKLLPDEDPESRDSPFSPNAPEETPKIDDASKNKDVQPLQGQVASSLEPQKDQQKNAEPRPPGSDQSPKEQQKNEQPRAPASVNSPKDRQNNEEITNDPASVQSSEGKPETAPPRVPASVKSSEGQQENEEPRRKREMKDPSSAERSIGRDVKEEPEDEPGKTKLSRLSQLLLAPARLLSRLIRKSKDNSDPKGEEATDEGINGSDNPAEPDDENPEVKVDIPESGRKSNEDSAASGKEEAETDNRKTSSATSLGDVLEQNPSEGSDNPKEPNEQNSEVKVDLPESGRKLSLSQSNDALAASGKEEAEKDNRKTRSATSVADVLEQNPSEGSDNSAEPNVENPEATVDVPESGRKSNEDSAASGKEVAEADNRKTSSATSVADVLEQNPSEESDIPMAPNDENSEVKVDIPESGRKLSISQSNDALAASGKEEAQKDNRKTRSATSVADVLEQNRSENSEPELQPAIAELQEEVAGPKQ